MTLARIPSYGTQGAGRKSWQRFQRVNRENKFREDKIAKALCVIEEDYEVKAMMVTRVGDLCWARQPDYERYVNNNLKEFVANGKRGNWKLDDPISEAEVGWIARQCRPDLSREQRPSQRDQSGIGTGEGQSKALSWNDAIVVSVTGASFTRETSGRNASDTEGVDEPSGRPRDPH